MGSFKMTERKAVIKNADMSEDMQTDAVSVPPRPLKNTTSKRTLRPSSKRNSTKSAAPPGTASLDVTSEATLLMRPSISSTSTLDRSQFYSSSPDKSRSSSKTFTTLPLQVKRDFKFLFCASETTVFRHLSIIIQFYNKISFTV